MWRRTETSGSRSTWPARRSGFTLLEILVVIAIIALLAALVGPEVLRNASDARTQAARTQVEMLALALDGYRLDNHHYPTTDQGLQALRTLPTTSDPPANWRGPYLRRTVPKDPWGRDYVYVAPGRANPNTVHLRPQGRRLQVRLRLRRLNMWTRYEHVRVRARRRERSG